MTGTTVTTTTTEMPTISGTSYASNTIDYQCGNVDLGEGVWKQIERADQRRHQLQQIELGNKIPKIEMATSNRRLIQVFICDPDENVPLKDSLLYSGEQQLTDLTDQELFFEIPIKDLLATHNEKRITFIDKKVKERTQHLEPARVRDLRMVVTTVAQF